MVDICNVVLERARETPDQLYLRYLVDGTPASAVELTYGALVDDAGRVAKALEAHTERGDRVILLFTPSLDFARALWGTLLSGRVAVPAYPPDPKRLQRTLERLLTIIEEVDATTVVTSSFLARQAEALTRLSPALARLTWVVVDELEEGGGTLHPSNPEVLALLQFTSGSTGGARGVAVTHGQLGAQCAMLRNSSPDVEVERNVGWTPFYHDMGLIMAHFYQLGVHTETTWMSPEHFLRDPRTWMAAAAHYRATLLVSPDFAFGLTVRKCPAEWASSLDWSSVVTVVSSAEPVRATSLRSFGERFRLDRSVFRPAFGLAENTLIATGGRSYLEMTVDPVALDRGEVVESKKGTTLVSSGGSMGGTCIVVHPETREVLGDRRVGEIWLDQPSKAQGYWKHPEATAEVFAALTSDGRGPFLRTGDLGFLWEHDLFVTGRLKDLIVVRGRNLQPHEIEDTLQAAHPDIRPGCISSFAVPTEHGEVVGAALEVRGPHVDIDAVIDACRAAVQQGYGARLGYLAVLAPHTLPKTSSGKLQRSLARKLLDSGELASLALFDQRAAEDPTELLQELVERIGHRGLDAEAWRMTLTELGIDSLAVYELRALIEERTGVKLGPEVAARGSLETLSAWLRRPPPDAMPEVIRIPSRGTGVPLVLLPGAFGDTGSVRPLGELLAAARPVFVLEPPWTPHGGAIEDVEELAAWYCQRVLALVPEGPIHVAGYSFGSFVAIELGRALARAGREVPLVVCIDGRHWRLSWREWIAVNVLGRNSHRERSMQARRLKEVMLASEIACVHYQPKPYWGSVLWLRSEISQPRDRQFFDSFVRRLEQVHIPGKHRTCMQAPYLEPLAHRIGEALDRV